MDRLCRFLLFAFALAYIAALGLLAIGTFGLFGGERDPLAGVFLIPLGLPWNLLIDRFPAASLPWLAAGAPLVNLLLIWGMCRARRSKQRPPGSA